MANYVELPLCLFFPKARDTVTAQWLKVDSRQINSTVRDPRAIMAQPADLRLKCCRAKDCTARTAFHTGPLSPGCAEIALVSPHLLHELSA
eukprot:scaffold7420_cov97-Isochrysis_galbana.AAC.4